MAIEMVASKKNSKNKRLKIAEAALICFIEHGIHSTTNTAIAKLAKVPQPLITYYYPTFEDLFLEVIGLILEDLKTLTLTTVAKHSADPHKTLLEYAKVPLTWAIQKPEFVPIWTFFYHLATYQKPFTSLNDEIRRGGRERIVLMIYKYQDQMGLRLNKKWTVESVAHAIQEQITGSLLIAITESSDRKAARERCEESVRAFLKSVYISEDR